MSLVIRDCAISEVMASPNIEELLAEYAAESRMNGMPSPAVKWESYKKLEADGILRPIGAFYKGVLIGFIGVITSVIPHYSACVAVIESFFVAKVYRKTGAGLRLVSAAEACAKEDGACGILISAPLNGILAKVLPRINYIETNRVFFKGFN